jgi:uncharacterized glyoxalase superfamily protein PhnB
MASKKKSRKAVKKAEKQARKAAKKARKAAKRAMKAPSGKASRLLVRVRRSPATTKKPRNQPETLRLRSAGPSFTVADINKSLAFYRDALGFVPRERWEEDGRLIGIELVAGSVRFWLGQDDWKKGRDRVKGQGFRMYCETAQNIDALAARVRSAGGTIVEEPKNESWGGRAFGVRDFDGFVITFASNV